MSETMTVTDAKAKLSELVASVARTHEHVDAARNGDPPLDWSHVPSWPASRHHRLLSDELIIEDIRQAEDNILAGRSVEAEALRGSMLSRRPADG